MSEKSCPAYRQALVNLFSNKPVYRFSEAYQDNLNVEKNNGLLFFDKDRDEISFYHFNVAASEIYNLRVTAKTNDEKGIVSSFNKTFLKDKNLNWTSAERNGNADVSQYVNSLFNSPVTPPLFNGGVSMSNFVFPLVLNQIDTSKYAEEYVLIILSDFLTGSMLGNTKDLDRVRDIYQVPYGIGLTQNSPVSFVKKEIDFMASQYYKIDFFQYSFIPAMSPNSIGIISFKIKPKVGVLTPEDVALFVDGDLSLSQRGYQSSDFKTNETKIKFTHNKNLVPTEVTLAITFPFGKSERVLFQDVIATKLPDDTWVSKYSTDNNLMQFDSNKLTYELPSLKITLDSIINKQNFESLKFKYDFKTKYSIANTQPLNFLYSTERALPIENVD